MSGLYIGRTSQGAVSDLCVPGGTDLDAGFRACKTTVLMEARSFGSLPYFISQGFYSNLIVKWLNGFGLNKFLPMNLRGGGGGRVAKLVGWSFLLFYAKVPRR